MYKKLSEENLTDLIKAGINEFADKGYSKANLGTIARNAGVSVGVIYKYYSDKEALFLACVRYSLNDLTRALKEVAFNSDNLEGSLRGVIRTLINHARNNEAVNRVYHEITLRSNDLLAKELADEVEEISAMVYTDLLRKARDEGKCREDIDPARFAFFCDNLFMMLQFSYSCDYYRERLKLYCGNDAFTDDKRMEDELTKFMLSGINGR